MSEVFIIEFAVLLVLFIFAFAVIDRISPSKSKQYRQDLSNMYVVGKIKQIAKKDGLNLNEEFLEFAKATKNKKIDFEALDVTVERELQEKIADGKKTAVEKTATPKE